MRRGGYRASIHKYSPRTANLPMRDSLLLLNISSLVTNLDNPICHSCSANPAAEVSGVFWWSYGWPHVPRVSKQFIETNTYLIRGLSRGGNCHLATDCNFHQRHLKKAGDGTYFYEPEYFLTKEAVDAAGRRIEKARKRTPNVYKSPVPDTAVDQCEDSHTAASANKAQTGEPFDDKGMGALVCRHDIPLFFVNIDTPGEQQKYAVALIDHVFSLLPLNASVVILYDIGCVLDRSVHIVSNNHLVTKPS